MFQYCHCADKKISIRTPQVLPVINTNNSDNLMYLSFINDCKKSIIIALWLTTGLTIPIVLDSLLI